MLFRSPGVPRRDRRAGLRSTRSGADTWVGHRAPAWARLGLRIYESPSTVCAPTRRLRLPKAARRVIPSPRPGVLHEVHRQALPARRQASDHAVLEVLGVSARLQRRLISFRAPVGTEAVSTESRPESSNAATSGVLVLGPADSSNRAGRYEARVERGWTSPRSEQESWRQDGAPVNPSSASADPIRPGCEARVRARRARGPRAGCRGATRGSPDRRLPRRTGSAWRARAGRRCAR